MRALIFASLCLGAIFGAPSVRADGVVISAGGLAQACYQAAKAEGVTADALHVCETALQYEELAPHDRAGTLVNQGVLLIRKKAYAEALAGLDEARKLAPDIPEIAVNRGAALLGLHRWVEAKAALDLGLGANPSEPEKAYFNRAEAEEALGDLKSAYLDFAKAIEIAPKWDAPRQEIRRYTVQSGSPP